MVANKTPSALSYIGPLVVAGVVMIGLQPRECHLGGFTKRNLESLRSLSAFLLQALQASLTSRNKKTLHFTYGELASSVRARFLLVAGTGELSNFELMNGLAEIVDFVKNK